MTVMSTGKEVLGKPGSASELERSQVACVSAILKEKFPGIIALTQSVSEHEAAEVGGNWILDVYFVPSCDLMAFEDFAADLAVGLSDESGISVLIISHTEEATQQYYLDMLKECCPFDLENRGRGSRILIVPDFDVFLGPVSWSLVGLTTVQTVWSEPQLPIGRDVRKAA